MFFAVFMERLQENYDGEPERKIVLQRRGDTLEIAQERSVAAKRSFVSFLVSVFLPQGLSLVVIISVVVVVLDIVVVYLRC